MPGRSHPEEYPVKFLYPLIPVFGAAGFMFWSARRLVREVRSEVA